MKKNCTVIPKDFFSPDNHCLTQYQLHMTDNKLIVCLCVRSPMLFSVTDIHEQAWLTSCDASDWAGKFSMRLSFPMTVVF